MKSANVLCIIQARVKSARLPAKVLRLILGKPMISYVVERVLQAKLVNHVLLATGAEPDNKPLEKIASGHNVKYFEGSESDVLDRYYQAAHSLSPKPDLVVRVTGDCPLIDPDIIDEVIQLKLNHPNVDYASNIDPPFFPDGLDVEVFTLEALNKAWQKTLNPVDREHVTLFIRKSGHFKMLNLTRSENLSNERWTVDNEEDFQLAEAIIRNLSQVNPHFRMKDILNLKKVNPDIFSLNHHIERNEGLKKSMIDWQNSIRRKYQKSQELLKKARKLTPLGAQTYSRSYRYFSEGASPAFTERGQGSHVWDVDGNEMIDFILSLGAVTVGYNNPEINVAITTQLAKGITFSQPSPVSIQLAEKITQIIPSAEMVRFVKNGSDATSAAIRLARAYTNKDTIIACGYHGWQDWYIASTANHKGIPKDVLKYTLSCEYNHAESLEKLFHNHKDKIAAVIMEPVQGNGPKSGYLDEMKRICHKNNALLIFDEVVSGFRMGIAGGQGYYKVTPDLSAFGKGMGNGMPISCVVGKADILNQIEGGVFISTTFGDETLSLAAALKTIEILERPGSFEHMWKMGEIWMKGIQKHIDEQGISHIVSLMGVAPHCGIAFQSAGNFTSHDFQSIYQQKILEHGILTLGVNNFCLSHTTQEVLAYVKAAGEALEDVKRAIDFKSVDEILAGAKVTPVFKRN